MIGHDRADGLAGCKEEICYIDLVLVIFLGDRFTILIDQCEIRNLMILPFILDGTIYQDLPWPAGKQAEVQVASG